MEFSVSREQLLEKGQTAASVVERKQTMAILANILIEVDATGAVVTGTDLDSEISLIWSWLRWRLVALLRFPEESWLILRRLFLRDLLSNLSRKVRR